MQYLLHKFHIMNLNHDMKCLQHIQYESCHNGSYNWLPRSDWAPCPQVNAPFVWEWTSSTSNKSNILVIGCSRIRLSSLFPLLPRSNFTLRTTPSLSEFVPLTLHIGQWFHVVKSVFCSTMSQMQKCLRILTHFWRCCKAWINSFIYLLQNSLLRCWILLHLLLQHQSGFWSTTTFVFIVSILFGDIGIGLYPSLIVSTANGREFIIISVSVISVCRDSSSKPNCSHVSVAGTLKLP